MFLNILKSDVYRIKKSPSFYWFCFIIFICAFAVVSFAAAGIQTIPMASFHVNAMNLLEFSFLMQTINLFVVIFSVLFLAKDFRNNFVKITVAKGVNRSDYFTSKLLSVFAVSFIFNLVCLITRFVVAGLFLDFGTFNPTVFLFLFSEIINAISWASFTTMLVMFFRSSAVPLVVSITANLSGGLTLGILQGMLSSSFRTNVNLTQFWFGFAFEELAQHANLNPMSSSGFSQAASRIPGSLPFKALTVEQAFLKGFLVSIVWIAFLTYVAYYRFSKTELK